MAYGTGKNGDPGDWSQRPPINEEPRTPAQQHPTPPVQTAPPAARPKDNVTPDSIFRLAMGLLPSNEDAIGFASWRAEVLPAMADDVIKLSGLNTQDFNTHLGAWGVAIKATMDALNQKNVAAVPPAGEPCPPLPGSCSDPTCSSLFDVNDLAIRGRKTVSSKRIYFPIIFPEFRLDKAQQWGLGQKVEFSQEWRHEGFTLGSLISSFSLLPAEEVTLEVSAWQRSKSEIQQEQDEATKQSLEQELKRTDEQTISNEAASENGWSVSATAAVSYGPVSASASASANGSSSDRVQQAQRHVQESTSRATSEVSARRAVKITHTTESQTEQKSVRRMKNPNQCHTVTFNFFQVIKLIDLQMRFLNDAPVFYYPGLFPATYTNGQPVRIPYEAVEAFTSPSLFLTQFFEIDRDLSQEIHGLALRVRMDVGRSPASGLHALAEALVIAAKYLLRLDPAAHTREIAAFINNYASSATNLRDNALRDYGPGKGESLQLNTPGVYVDSLLGRCSACEDEINSERYVAIKREDADRMQIEGAASLLEQEAERRKLLLKANHLEPFDQPAMANP